MIAKQPAAPPQQPQCKGVARAGLAGVVRLMAVQGPFYGTEVDWVSFYKQPWGRCFGMKSATYNTYDGTPCSQPSETRTCVHNHVQS